MSLNSINKFIWTYSGPYRTTLNFVQNTPKGFVIFNVLRFYSNHVFLKFSNYLGQSTARSSASVLSSQPGSRLLPRHELHSGHLALVPRARVRLLVSRCSHRKALLAQLLRLGTGGCPSRPGVSQRDRQAQTARPAASSRLARHRLVLHHAQLVPLGLYRCGSFRGKQPVNF